MRRWAVPTFAALLVVVVIATVAWIGSDRQAAAPRTAPPTLGNPELARAAARLVGEDHGQTAVAYLTADTTRFAFLGADPALEYEIGSLTKVMTGVLLADAVRQGRVRLDTPVGDLLPLGDAPVATTTLEALATYRSGLSLWGPGDPSDDPVDPHAVENPYRFDVPQMLARAQADPLTTRGRYRYSNLGHALLGTALAERARVSYDDLLADRLLGPLGLECTRVGRDGDRNQSRGYTGRGRTAMPWNLQGFAPAGGVRSTIEDIALWARAIMTAPTGGVDPFAGRFVDDAGNGVGLGANTATVGSHEVIWKDGQTGGFAAFLAVDRVRRHAVVVLSRSAAPFDRDDLRLLGLDRELRRTASRSSAP